MPRLLVSLVVLAVICVTPAFAAAAVRSELDRDNGVRLTLDGRSLTATIVRQPNWIRVPPTTERLFGERILGACGTGFDRATARVVHRRRRWTPGAASLRFGFRRDISHRVLWCLIEHPDGGDVAFVSFVPREPARFLAKGRSPGGQWWRLASWRGEMREPCLFARFADDSFRQCLGDEADRDARLATIVQIPHCPGDTFVYGAVSRSASSVRLTLFDGSSVEASLYDRPHRSRVRARFFMAALEGVAPVREVHALDASGQTLGRQRYEPDSFEHPCGTVIPD